MILFPATGMSQSQLVDWLKRTGKI